MGLPRMGIILETGEGEAEDFQYDSKQLLEADALVAIIEAEIDKKQDPVLKPALVEYKTKLMRQRSARVHARKGTARIDAQIESIDQILAIMQKIYDAHGIFEIGEDQGSRVEELIQEGYQAAREIHIKGMKRGYEPVSKIPEDRDPSWFRVDATDLEDGRARAITPMVRKTKIIIEEEED